MNIRLNEKDMLLYNMIEDYILRYGYSPSYKEMSEATNMSKSTVCYHIRRLQIYGIIQTDSRGPPHRAMRLASVCVSKTEQMQEFG